MKHAGCCTLCDQEVFEVITRFSEGLLHRLPREIGKPLDDAIRIDFVLSDGSVMYLTFCQSCSVVAAEPESYTGIWRRVLEAFKEELNDDYRIAIGAKPLDEVGRNANSQFVIGLTQKSIIGKVGLRKWKEICA